MILVNMNYQILNFKEKINMEKINVLSIEHLEDIMIENLEENKSVSLVSDFETVWEIAMDFHRYEDVEFEYVDINTDYDKEYYLTLMMDDDNNATMAIEKAFCEEIDNYLATDGIVFIEDTVDYKYLTDVKNNKHLKDGDFTPIIFTFDTDDEKDNKCDDCLFGKEVTDSQVRFFVPACMDELVKAIDNLMDKYIVDNYR
jgi:hypothetical protein